MVVVLHRVGLKSKHQIYNLLKFLTQTEIIYCVERNLLFFFVELFFVGLSLSQSPSVSLVHWFSIRFSISPLSSPVFSPTLAHSLSPSAKPPRLDGFVKRISFDL